MPEPQRVDLAAAMKAALGELQFQIVALSATNEMLRKRIAELEAEADEQTHAAGDS